MDLNRFEYVKTCINQPKYVMDSPKIVWCQELMNGMKKTLSIYMIL